MMNLSNSSVLILSATVFSFTHLTLAITAFSLGVVGAFVNYCLEVGEKQQKAKEVESATENISTIISNLASGISSKDRNNIH